MVNIPRKEEVESACMNTKCAKEGICPFSHESITTGYTECLLKDSNGNYPWQPEWMQEDEE